MISASEDEGVHRKARCVRLQTWYEGKAKMGRL